MGPDVATTKRNTWCIGWDIPPRKTPGKPLMTCSKSVIWLRRTIKNIPCRRYLVAVEKSHSRYFWFLPFAHFVLFVFTVSPLHISYPIAFQFLQLPLVIFHAIGTCILFFVGVYVTRLAIIPYIAEYSFVIGYRLRYISITNNI